MFKPPYWFFKNIKFPEIDINHIIHQLKSIHRHKDMENTSAYYLENHKRPDKIWSNYYSDIHTDILKRMGIYSTSRYEYMYWSQLYKKNDKHRAHHHLNLAADDKVILSWVHFIRSPFKGFRFVDCDGNYFVPPEQEDGDLICFPSYLWHEALANTTDEQRLVVAGNIKLTHLDPP